MLSGSEIHKFPEVQVWNNRIYGHDMKPVPNGLLDPRMVMPRSELLFSHVYFHGLFEVDSSNIGAPLWHHSSCCNLFPRVKFQGIPNKREKCSTCHGEFSDCPGHFGYLKLALPVFNVGFFNCILDVLKCICKVLPLRSLHYGLNT